MSIVMNLYYTGTNGNARKFAEEMESSGTAAAIRAEAGNERYAYFFPMNDPETVLLIDAWTDQMALDAHHATPMMSTIAALREKYDLRMKAERYVSDASGVPASDTKFIRT
ncbi:MAG: antibiotic biosynthesis monooxygenase [Oscillibacter sp.]|nr:antibiotic biosynthesis monooxygenase [Oscillibacter sp.]